MTLAKKYATFLPLTPLLMGFYGVRNINDLLSRSNIYHKKDQKQHQKEYC